MVKNVKVLDEFDPFKNDKVFYELHPPKNAKTSAENAALKNPNIQDKFEVTQNDIKIHSADDNVLDFDKTTHWPRPIPMEKHLPMDKLKASLGGVSGVMKTGESLKRRDYVACFFY